MKTRFTVLVVVAAMVLGTTASAQSTGKARGSGGVQVFTQQIICFPPFGCFTFFVPSGETGHFNFSVDIPGAPLPNTIDLVANNPVTGDHIRMQDGGVVIDPFSKSLFGGGPCTVDGQPGTCNYIAQDRGEPGDDDFFQLVYNSTGGNGAFSGQLVSGNIEITVGLQ
jgi:hypothetical protein